MSSQCLWSSSLSSAFHFHFHFFFSYILLLSPDNVTTTTCILCSFYDIMSQCLLSFFLLAVTSITSVFFLHSSSCLLHNVNTATCILCSICYPSVFCLPLFWLSLPLPVLFFLHTRRVSSLRNHYNLYPLFFVSYVSESPVFPSCLCSELKLLVLLWF